MRHCVNMRTGSTSMPLLVQSTSVDDSLLVPGPILPPGTRAPITVQGLSFPPIPSEPIMFSGAPGAPAPMQSAVILPMPGAPLPSQAMPYPSAFMAPPAWPMYMPHYLPRPQAQQSSMQAEREKLARQRHDLEARELEVEWITRALNLNAVIDAKAKSAAPMAESSRTCTQEQAPLNQNMLAQKSHFTDPWPLHRVPPPPQ